MCACVCVCVMLHCIHTCMHTCVYIFTHLYTCIYTHTNARAHTYMYTYRYNLSEARVSYIALPAAMAFARPILSCMHHIHRVPRRSCGIFNNQYIYIYICDTDTLLHASCTPRSATLLLYIKHIYIKYIIFWFVFYFHFIFWPC